MRRFNRKINGSVIEKIGMVVLALMLASAATMLISHAFGESSQDRTGGSISVGVNQNNPDGLEPVSDDGDSDGSSSGDSQTLEEGQLMDKDGNIYYDGEGFDPDGTKYQDVEDWINSRPVFEGTGDEISEQEWRYYYNGPPEDFFDFGTWDGYTGGIPISDGTVGGYVYVPEKIYGSFITKVDNNAFRNNADLLAISLPGTIREIGVGAFAGAKNLHLVEFRGKIQAETLRLPELNIIGNHAFGDTSSLKHLFIGGEPELIGNQAFSNSPDLVLYMEMEHPGYAKHGNSTYVGKEEWSSRWFGDLDPETQIVWGVSHEEFTQAVGE